MKAAGPTLLPAEQIRQPEPETKPAIEVLMINGGGSRSINYQSHLLHLKQLNKLLLASGFKTSQITVMSADGSDPAADLAVRETQTESSAWMLDGTYLGNLLKSRMEFENSKIDGVTLLPATRESLRQWFNRAGGRLHPGDTLFIYVTDHGTKNKDDLQNNRITLWGKNEYLDVEGLRSLFAKLEHGVRVVQLMSQCYSGSFAGLMYRQADDALPSGDVCGFFSSTPERPAYGCYPENRNKENIGHSFRFIEELAAGQSFGDAHDRVLIGDDTPDVPLKTSDVYLDSLLQEWSRHSGRPLEAKVDELLREAWNNAARWESEIDLLDRISEFSGYFSPRFLSELKENSDALEDVSQAFNSYGKSWEAACQELNRENLNRFLDENEAWSQSATQDAVSKLSSEAKSRLARDLLSALDSHTRRNKQIMKRMELLKQKAEDTTEAAYRMEVRQAVVLRLRTVLTSIAGRVYIEKYATAAQRKAYEALSGCESFAPMNGKRPAAADIIARAFPSYDEELELGKTIIPGWMGIRYMQIDKEIRDNLRVGSGAVVVSSVLPDSPAMNAGLEPGDIIIGSSDEMFVGPNRIREWVMTAPIGISQTLVIQRGERRLEISLTPMPKPGRWSDVTGSIKIGSAAPILDELELFRGTPPTESVRNESYLLFFFATWCAPCKASLPELATFEQQRKLPIIAITDEPAQKIEEFFEKQKGFFPETVLIDEPRHFFIKYGVNAIPAFALVDHGMVKSIKTGYRTGQILGLE